MDKYNQIKIVETVLYVLQRTGGIDYYHLFKILYFAEKEHLAKWGSKMIADDFHALPYGPVPTRLYDAVKYENTFDANISDLLWEAAEFAKEDASCVILPKRDANMDYISKSEKDALDHSIEENANASFYSLKDKSHDSAWSKAFSRTVKTISSIDMAKSGGAKEAMIEYIADQQSLDAALL